MESDVPDYPLRESYVENVGDEVAYPVVAIHHLGCRCTVCPLDAGYLL